MLASVSGLQNDKQILGAQGLTFGDLRQSMGNVAFEMAARKFKHTVFFHCCLTFLSFSFLDYRFYLKKERSFFPCFLGVGDCLCWVCWCSFS